ncbi:unnamed protein product [Orchesella dallaii]|uniref:Monocarboxylate transporter 10 n=1 Tax=Orchesella dallaii TaxID=48710 RepID=A0ABP1QU44_9HEXA
MLESKLKRRYTWPVELLGVIVEDGEVIIGTEEQIFPDGQINSNFINLQHQQNLNLQTTCAAVGANNNVGLCVTTNGSKSDGGASKSDCDSQDNSKKNNPLPQQQNSSNFGLLQIQHPSDTEQVHLLPSSSRRHGVDESENFSIFSPRIINIVGSHGRTQVEQDHSFCTCKSTNKHDADGIPCGGAINNECGSSGTCAPHPGASKSRDHNGRYPRNSQYDMDDNFSVNNEILQVQVSSLYPVTEEDVFTTTSETNEISSGSKKGAGSGTFQPIQDKFNFLRKKSRDSRKRKQQQNQHQQQKEPSSSTSATVSTSPKAPINNGHKDYCPHSKVFQVKSVSPPGKSSDSSSVVISKGEIRENYYCSSSASASSNNNTPSHHSHLSNSQNSQSVSHCTQADSGVAPANTNTKIGANCKAAALANKTSANVRRMSSIVGGNATFGKGTALNGGNLNCKALHPETEGKIPAANGTATGAMALQVNTPNGDVKKVITLWQNYYPEGQWGWIVVFCALVVQAINHGFQLSFSTFMVSVDQRFFVGKGDPVLLGLLGSFSAATSLFFSPLWVALCKQKSTRLAGVFGGLIASLGCLFTSFATQFHQLFISYGAFVGVGVGLTRDASTLMVGQYFKRKRDIVEILVVSGSGVGIVFMSVSINSAIRSIGWRLGLQAVTGTILSTFFLGTCYRSASLYHPQRRAILHLKNQKRKVKVKDLARREDKPPLIDYSCLKSKTLQILLLSSAFTAFGINSPLYQLSTECGAEMDPFSSTLLHMYLGAAWVIGCCLFGLIVVQKNQECRVSKQYLCQVASVICGISIMALIATNGHNGLVVFVWVYGFSFGGYSYSLKVYTYERVRARHFARAWSFVQWSQAVPVLVSIPLTGYLNKNYGKFYGYCLSALSVFLGSACLFLTDVRRRRLSRRKAEKSSMKTCETLESTQSPKIRRLSFAFPVEQMSPQSKHESGDGQGSQLDPALLSKELTCISEEGLADMDFQDIYFEDWAEFLGGDCITSCNKVENCLASEYDAEFALLLDRRVRRWSTARNSIGYAAHAAGLGTTASAVASTVAGLSGQQHSILPAIVQSVVDGNGDNSLLNIESLRIPGGGPREIPVFKNHPWGNRPPPAQRPITVIDEASV